MDINWQLVLRQPFVNRKQLFAVQRLTIQIGKAAEAAQTELVNRTFQLIERRFDIASWQRKKSDKALGIFACDRRDGVIGNPGDSKRTVYFEAVRARRRNRQHMDVDTVLIHM